MLVFFQRTVFLARCLLAQCSPLRFRISFSRERAAHFLAVTLPFIITYLFYGRHLLILKLAILAVAFFCLK